MDENDDEMERLNWAGDNGVIGLSLSIYIKHPDDAFRDFYQRHASTCC